MESLDMLTSFWAFCPVLFTVPLGANITLSHDFNTLKSLVEQFLLLKNYSRKLILFLKLDFIF